MCEFSGFADSYSRLVLHLRNRPKYETFCPTFIRFSLFAFILFRKKMGVRDRPALKERLCFDELGLFAVGNGDGTRLCDCRLGNCSDRPRMEQPVTNGVGRDGATGGIVDPE